MESNSECDPVSKNEVMSKAKEKKQRMKQDEKLPTAPPTGTSVSESDSTRGLKKRSGWWDHYTKCEDAIDKAECIYCHRRIGCASKVALPLLEIILTLANYILLILTRNKNLLNFSQNRMLVMMGLL